MWLPHWVLRVLLLLLMDEHHCLMPSVHHSFKDTCIALIAQRYFRMNSSVGFLTTTTSRRNSQQPHVEERQSPFLEDNIVQQVGQSWKFSFVILQLTLRNRTHCICSGRPESFKAFDQSVIIGTADEIASCIEAFCFSGLTDNRSQFVVYLNAEPKNATAKVELVLAMFRRHNHQNVIVLVTNLQKEQDIYTSTTSGKSSLVDSCNGHLFRNNTPLFPEKLKHTFNDGLLKVGVVELPPFVCDQIGGGYAGVDIEIVKATASALNSTVEYIPFDQLKSERATANFPWSSCIGPWLTVCLGILSGEVDVGAGGFVLVPNMLQDFGHSQPYHRDAKKFFSTSNLVQSHRYMQQWVVFVLPLMALIHICTSFTMHFLEWRARPHRRSFGAFAMLVWSLQTEESTDVSKLSLRQVLLWASCAFCSLNMNTAFKSFLTSALALPLYVEKIQSVADILTSNEPFLWNFDLNGDQAEEIFGSDIALSTIHNRRVVCNDALHQCLTKFLSFPHYSLYAYKLDMRFVELAVPNRRYHPVSADMEFNDITFYTRNNYFLTRKVSTIIRRATQAGLIDFWFRKILENRNICSLRNNDWSQLRNWSSIQSPFANNPATSRRPLTMARFQIQFRLLGFGLFLAGGCFLLELLSVSNKCRLLCVHARKITKAVYKIKREAGMR